MNNNSIAMQGNQVGAMSGAGLAQPNRVPEVPARLEALGDALERLARNVAVLQDRMQPVTSPEEARAEKTGADPMPAMHTPVGDTLFNFYQRAMRLSREIESLIERLEV